MMCRGASSCGGSRSCMLAGLATWCALQQALLPLQTLALKRNQPAWTLSGTPVPRFTACWGSAGPEAGAKLRCLRSPWSSWRRRGCLTSPSRWLSALDCTNLLTSSCIRRRHHACAASSQHPALVVHRLTAALSAGCGPYRCAAIAPTAYMALPTASHIHRQTPCSFGWVAKLLG